MTKGQTMKFTPVKSSNLLGTHYDAGSKTLTIQFQGGSSHSYPDVPPHHAEALAKAESPGKYFHANIRNAFKSKKLGT